MLMTIAVVLIIAWLLGFLVVNVSSAALHLLLVVAAVVIVVQLVRGRRAM